MLELLQTQLAELVVLGRVCLAALLGSVIGIERELADKPAGLRTHMLVAGSAALFVGLGDFLVDHFLKAQDEPLMRLDPIRLVEALVTGVAFLGAGTIIRDRREGHAVQGLTTAASILFTAIVGMAVALSLYTLAVGATLLVLLTLRAVAWVEHRLLR